MLRARFLVCLAAVGCAFAFPLSAGAVTEVFTFTGGEQDFVVPAGVTEVTVEACGAEGGGDNSGLGLGANGGCVTATIPATALQTLVVVVGGMGGNGIGADGGTDGFNGGGAGGNGDPSSLAAAGGGAGGGASDVRQGGSALGDRVVVGGGGGGGGSGADGGAGGGTTGAAGQNAGVSPGGGGGTQSDGGDGAGNGAEDGSFGLGGAGGDGTGGPFGGGGGGGGYWGGGGGQRDTGTGGGGGSSFAIASATNVTHQQGVRAGEGLVTITYEVAPDTPAPALESLTPASGPVGTVVTILGEGFADATGVLFGDFEAAFTVVSDTQLVATAPPQPPPASQAAFRSLQGLGLGAPVVPVVVVGPGGASNELSFAYTVVTVSVPGPCDPLVRACGGGAQGQSGPPPFAPPSGGGGGPAVGQARMPNLRATVSGRWQDGTIRVTVRVLISKPRLVNGPFLVRVRIPSLEQTKLVRVLAHGKRVRTVHLRFTGPASVIGTLVIVRVDPTDRILETRNRDNTDHARIT